MTNATETNRYLQPFQPLNPLQVLDTNYFNQIQAVLNYRQAVGLDTPVVFNFYGSCGETKANQNQCLKDVGIFKYTDSLNNEFLFVVKNDTGFENDYLKVDVTDGIHFTFKATSITWASIKKVSV